MGDPIGIPRCDAELCAWAREVVGDAAQVSLVDPGALRGPSASLDPDAPPVVEIALLEVRPDPGADAPGLPVLRLRLRYVVAVRSADVGRAHAALSTLAFAAMSREVDAVERDVDWIAVWAALGAPPRPSLMLSAQVKEARVVERRAPKPVRGARIIEAVLPLREGSPPLAFGAGGSQPGPVKRGIEVVKP